MNQKQEVEGAFLTDDQIPDPLLELISRIFKEQWPVLRNTVKSLDTWLENNPNKACIPRMICEHDFTIGEVTEKRAIASFHHYKAQRVIDCYVQFSAEEKQSVDRLLQSVGGVDSMRLVFKSRLSRVNNQLILSV